MARLGMFLLPLFYFQCAFAKATTDQDAPQDISIKNALEMLSHRVGQFEEMLLARDMKIKDLEDRLAVRDQKIEHLEEKVTEHDHYIRLLKENPEFNDKPDNSGRGYISKYLKAGMRKDNDDRRVDVVNESESPEGSAEKDTDPDDLNDESLSSDQPRPVSSNGLIMGRVAENVIKRHRRADIEAGVAFFSTLSNNTKHIGQNQAIVFDRVVTNIGNAYNNFTGSFTAPVSGTYVFSVTLATENAHVSWYNVFKNATKVSRMRLNGADNSYDSSSQTVVLRLAQGDAVTVRHDATDHALHGYGYCVFSGFMLQSSYESVPIVGK